MEIKNCMREIIKIENKSLVEVYDKANFGVEETKKFVVCRNFDQSKPYGNAWSHAIGYFEMWSYETREEALNDALKCFMAIESHPISYERLLEIASESLMAHWAAEDTELAEYCENTLHLTDEEWKELGLPEKQKYDIIEVTYIKAARCTKTLVVPKGTTEWNLDSYFDSYDIDEDEFEFDNSCDIDEVYKVNGDLTYREAEEFGTYENDIDDL